MPDINLLSDTQQPNDPTRPKPVPPTPGPVTDPTATPKGGLTAIFRSFLGRRATPTDIPPQLGKMAVTRQRTGERILSEKRTVGSAVIPLPEEDDEFQVNLLGDDNTQHVNIRQKFIQLGLAAIGAAVLVTAARFGVGVYGKSVDREVTNTKEQVVTVQQQIEQLKKQSEPIQAITERTTAIEALLDSHIRWTSFFDQLERYTLPTVTYGPSFTGSIQGTMTLAAKTTSFEEVAKQYLVYQNAISAGDFITSFSINGSTRVISKEGQSVNFSVTLNFVPELLTVTTASTKLTTTDRDAISCYLEAHPDTLANFPTILQSVFQVPKTAALDAHCATLAAAALSQAQALLTTDTDHDGLNNYLEGLAGTSTSISDTDGDTVTDMQEVLTCSNPLGAGSTANCDTSQPLKP